MISVSTMEERWHAYMAAYGAHEEIERKRLLELCVSDDVTYTNPSGDGKGLTNLADHIDKFQKSIPGAYFETEKLYAQTDKLLAVWSLYKKDGTKMATGYNFVRPSADGRFNYMAGFF